MISFTKAAFEGLKVQIRPTVPTNGFSNKCICWDLTDDLTDELPDEVLDRILHFLDAPDLWRATQVCKRWADRVHQESLWCALIQRKCATEFATLIMEPGADGLTGIAAGLNLRHHELELELAAHRHSGQPLGGGLRQMLYSRVACLADEAKQLRVLQLRALQQRREREEDKTPTVQPVYTRNNLRRATAQLTITGCDCDYCRSVA